MTKQKWMLLTLGAVVVYPIILLAQEGEFGRVVTSLPDVVPTGAEDQHMLTQLGIAGYVAMKMESLKQNPDFAWLSSQTDRLTKLISLLLGFLTAMGITWVFDVQADGYATAYLKHIPWSTKAVWDVGQHTFEQYWATKLVYHGMVKGQHG